MDYLRRTWAEIGLDAIKHNFESARAGLAKGCLSMVVVKADAYGHGDIHVPRVLQEAGADWFSVSNINEALSLRRHGITRPILILGFTPPDLAETLSAMTISQSVYSSEYAQELSAAATKHGVNVDCQIKVDTGMTRIGFYAQCGSENEAAKEIEHVCTLPNLNCSGIFTHFACADEPVSESDCYTHRQFECFIKTIDILKERGVSFTLRHCCNSAASLRFPEMHLDMARLGDIIYGLPPSPACKSLCNDLRPAMTLHTTVTMVKKLEEGVQISYGRRYTTTKAGQTIASIAIGYADGYSRAFTNRGRVILHGEFAPIVGTVCMDQLMIDVSEIPDVKMGDIVTLVGTEDDKSITFDDLAKLNGTINYEEVCLIGRRVPRVYMEGGKVVAAVDYVNTPI